ncbi:MAG: DUF4012 domain-containing protein, partial [Patescibacteria group bacterium]|nr:DUF4012 domain-containing protein [Patescibacteria group bacterium]
ELYFSKPYLAKKIESVIVLAKQIRTNADSQKGFGVLGDNLNDLQKSLAGKGQYLVFLSLNPLFDSQVVDLSRLLLINQSVNNTKNIGVAALKSDNYLSFKINLWLGKMHVKQIKQTFGLIQEPEFEFYKSQINPYLDEVIGQVNYLENHSRELAQVLGVDNERRYLLLFPNNKEERNWGGYSGTYGELVLENGKEPQFFMRDIYYLDRLVRGDDVNSTKKPGSATTIPADLKVENKLFDGSDIYTWWYLRNTGTSLDFAINAQRAIWSYENVHSQNQVDGVIVLTPDLIVEILKVIGPIEMKDYKVVVSADNFRDVIEDKVEFDNDFKKNIDKTKDPKQILADLAPIFLQRLKEANFGQKIAIGQAVIKNFQEKQIMAYFEDEGAQNLARHYDITGEIKESLYDYLAIYSSNLNGMKSSLRLERDYQLSSQISANGNVENNLEIKIKNNSTGKENFSGMMDNLLEIAVPLGAKLGGFERNQENYLEKVGQISEKDKTIFYCRYYLSPQEEVNFDVKYTLQNKITDHWGLILQKQPGIEQFNFTYNLNSDKKVISEQGLINQEQVVRTDKEFKLKIYN